VGKENVHLWGEEGGKGVGLASNLFREEGCYFLMYRHKKIEGRPDT